MSSPTQPPAIEDTQHDAEMEIVRARVPRVVIAIGLLPLFALLVLFGFDQPLGQPHLLYRYSHYWMLRAPSALFAMIFATGAAILLHRAWQSEQGSGERRGMACIAVLGYVALIVWSFFAAPYAHLQHVFNFMSPSHDGAFVLEAAPLFEPEQISAYLKDGFYERVRQEPENMAGRRILSNPPGMTLLAAGCHKFIHSNPDIETYLINTLHLEEAKPTNVAQRRLFATAALLAIVLTALWGLSMIPAYRLFRLFLPIESACALSFAVVFNPATLTFTPGKDPAQLLFVLTIAWFWLSAYRRARWWEAAFCGMTCTVATMAGLIHVWILFILAVATLWHTASLDKRVSRWFGRVLLPTVVGGFAMSGAIYLFTGWNVARTALAVGLRYSEIQEGVIPDPLALILWGIALYTLFVGPGLWAIGLALRGVKKSSEANLGVRLLIVTVAVMAYTYFTANNNETPRLWIPFTPVLLLAISLRRSILFESNARNRQLCLALILLQLTCTLASWSLLDVRESEYRLFVTQRMWD